MKINNSFLLSLKHYSRYLCNDLKVESEDNDDFYWNINFSFYAEEEVNFSPDIEYLIKLQRIDKAVEAFEKLKKLGLVPIEEVVHWYNKLRYLAEDLQLHEPFIRSKYRAYIEIENLYRKVSILILNYTNNDKAKKALIDYNNIDVQNERELIKWLLKYENLPFYSMKETKNWKKTGILILETKPSLVVDCSGYLDGFLFNDIYSRHESEIMSKYRPTKEHYKQHNGGIKCTIETFLKLHNKYLDLF